MFQISDKNIDSLEHEVTLNVYFDKKYGESVKHDPWNFGESRANFGEFQQMNLGKRSPSLSAEDMETIKT